MTTQAPLGVWIEGVGLLAPGLPDWTTGAAVLQGSRPYEPAPTVLAAPTLLPPAERRRASRVVKLALAVGLEAVSHAGADAATLATVFTGSSGDGHNCHALCETLASDDRQVSPTRFHNSVHNTAAGYWGIATGATPPCQVLCAYDWSFGAGLLEAMAQVVAEDVPVLLVAYDAEYPEPLHGTRPIPDAGGIALLLSPRQTDRSLARLTAGLAEAPASVLDSAPLEKLRSHIPALRGLPLLQLLARGTSGSAHLEYLSPLRLQVGVDILAR